MRRWIVLFAISLVYSISIINAQIDAPIISADNIDQLSLLGAAYSRNCEWCENAYQFSADSSTYFLADDDVYNLWEMQDFTTIGYWESITHIYSAFVNYDGTRIAVLDSDNSLRTWMGRSGNLYLQQSNESTLLAENLELAVVLASPDGRYIAYSYRGGMAIRDFNTGAVVMDFDYDSKLIGHPLVFNANSTRLLYDVRGYRENEGLISQVWLWDADMGARPLEEYVVIDGGNDLAEARGQLSEDGQTALVVRDDIRVWNLVTGEQVLQVQPFLADNIDNPTRFAYNPSSNQLLIPGDSRSSLELWDTLSGTQLQMFVRDTSDSDYIFRPSRFAISPDGRYVLANWGNELWFWNLVSGDLIQHHTTNYANASFAFSKDGQLVFIVGGLTPKRLGIFSLLDGTLIGEVSGRMKHPFRIQMSPDGRTLALLSTNFVAWYGIPTSSRPVASVIIGQANDEYISLRAEPSFDGEIIGRVGGDVLITGRDSTNQFLYLGSHEGWVRSEAIYVDADGVSLDILPIIDKD